MKRKSKKATVTGITEGSATSDNWASALEAKLQGLSEHDLTIRVLVPLFKAIGYHDVIYHGGPDEEGKDIVCWKVDELGDLQLAVAQVKRFKPSRSASDPRSFSGVVNQLSQAVDQHVPHTDGQRYRPRTVYFITPYPLEARTLESRFDAYRAIKDRVSVLDGGKLARLVMRQLPTIARELVGRGPQVDLVISAELNNEVLLSALDYGRSRDLRDIYIDIGFIVGRVTTRLFFARTFRPKSVRGTLNREQWSAFRDAVSLCERTFGIRPLEARIEDIEADFERQRLARSKWGEASTDLEKEIRRIGDELARIDETLAGERRRLGTKEPELRAAHKELDRVLSQLATLTNEGEIREEMSKGDLARVRRGAKDRIFKLMPDADYASLVKAEPALRKKAQSLQANIRRMEKALRPLHAEADRLNEELKPLEMRRQELRAARPADPTFQVTVKGSALAGVLTERGRGVRARIQRFNKTTPNTSQLRQFLEECEGLFSVTNQLLKDRLIADSVGVGVPGQIQHADTASTRLRIPIGNVFDTGLNVIVLGEAGAGKTTSLQSYARRRSEGNVTGGHTIFAPLGRLVRAWERAQGGELDRTVCVTALESGVAAYLATLGARISSFELAESFREQGGCVLLDGVDEASREAPWMPLAIESIASRFPKLQIVTSSRMSGTHFEDIRFLGLTLLPFTEEQRQAFVRGWFASGEVRRIAEIEAHLLKEKEVSAVVRNPLLTTILCVLAENGVPLPASTVRLYEERMRLLLGHYDVHKGISRMSSARHVLEVIARKVAFRLHSRSRREEDREALYELASGSAPDLGKSVCERAVDELIDPCGVLLPMTDDGKFGFGHLQYQEFLVAKEMSANRSIEVVDYLNKPGWRGALVFFAQLSDTLVWLVERVIETLQVSACADSLMAMVDVGPKHERNELRTLVRRHLELDTGMPGPGDDFGYGTGGIALAGGFEVGREEEGVVGC